MSLAVQEAEIFEADVARQFAWYLDEAGELLAWRFKRAVDSTLFKLAALPDLGRKRHFRNPVLNGLRSFRVDPPFNRLLIFYRIEARAIVAWRLMHGSRDLPRRPVETFR
jgi:plasmid stabilization system protein ParE